MSGEFGTFEAAGCFRELECKSHDVRLRKGFEMGGRGFVLWEIEVLGWVGGGYNSFSWAKVLLRTWFE